MSSYHDEENRKDIARLRELQKELPLFLGEFFRARGDYTSAKTRLGYGYDLRLFFGFLTTETREFGGIKPSDFSLKDLSRIKAIHIEEFMEYLSYYIKHEEGNEYAVQNHQSGKSRKLSAVRSMFAYYYRKEKIAANPAELVQTPPIKERAKIYLDINEIAGLLDEAEKGNNLTKKQQDYHKSTNMRDLAILTLLAGTGIRVSECVGLNLNDINLDDASFRVIRKGGDEALLFFGPETQLSLHNYITLREQIAPIEGHEQALFLSMQRRRITDRAVQNLVKKYSKTVSGFKNISPHKLRTSFGTHMYRQTGDIYLVADLLGHKDVNTTRKHYADTHRDRGRRAVNELRLRDE